jgi:phosphoenolpyruvate synthase/pyruvate phosphate dikinase
MLTKETIKTINTAEFWARESNSPLFSLTNTRKELQDTLIIYQKGTSNFYNINQRETIKAKEGFKHFSQRNNSEDYKKITQTQIDKIKDFIKINQTLKYNDLTDKQLFQQFNKTNKIIKNYLNLYSQTEAHMFKQFENQQEDFKDLIEEISQIRFEMRKLIRPLFKIFIGQLLKETAKRNKIKLKELFFYTFNELNKLNHKIPNKIISLRKKGYALLITKKGYTIFTNKDFKEINKIIENKFSPKVKSLTGSVANQGKVIGIARVIIHNKQNLNKEYSKIREGEILVTDMTKPDMIIVCKKASAIITDEGGILCHAAIISREFNIPCIVGTKIGTKAIKTEDKLEVDAFNGKIKITPKK